MTRPSPKQITERVRQSQAFVAEQARRRGETEATARRQGEQAAEVTLEQMKRGAER